MSLVLTDGNDYETFPVSDNVVYALDGNDVVMSNATLPDLYGGNGSDFLGNRGVAIMYAFGGNGNDAIHGSITGDAIYGERDSDLLVGGRFHYPSAAGGVIVPDGPLTVSGADYLDGGESRDSLWGFDGDDVLLGGDGDDNFAATISVKDPLASNTFFSVAGGLYGGDGADYLDGGHGDDFLDGGNGADTLLGGVGNDFLYGGDGNDLLITGAPTTPTNGFSVANGGFGNDFIASFGNDYLLGGFGNDTIVASGGASSLFGEAGLDSLFGSHFNDLLDGGADNDTLSGGDGYDIFTGGAGVDVFAMDFDIRAGEFETITDFAGDLIGFPAAYIGYVGVVDTANGVLVYTQTGSTIWGALVTNTHDVAAVSAGIVFA